jgi:hypothetical protein
MEVVHESCVHRFQRHGQDVSRFPTIVASVEYNLPRVVSIPLSERRRSLISETRTWLLLSTAIYLPSFQLIHQPGCVVPIVLVLRLVGIEFVIVFPN